MIRRTSLSPILALFLCTLLAHGASGMDAPAVRPLPTLSELEAREASENRYPNIKPEFPEDVVRLVESNTFSSAEDFSRAANLAITPLPIYRSVRIQYELLLAASAKGSPNAEKLLPSAWDSVLHSLGRPLRFDVYGIVSGNPDSDEFQLDPAPKSIRDVMLHPVEARTSASKASNNLEVQQIVDEDQAIRKKWGTLSEADFKKVGAQDHARSVRIHEIIASGELRTVKDFANASLVLQHSSSFAGFELAHELAVCSMLLGNRDLGRWLVAATYDRMLTTLGHYQRFGTQGEIMLGRGGNPHMATVDEAGICDAERQALGCPTLAAKRADFYTKKH